MKTTTRRSIAAVLTLLTLMTGIAPKVMAAGICATVTQDMAGENPAAEHSGHQAPTPDTVPECPHATLASGSCTSASLPSAYVASPCVQIQDCTPLSGEALLRPSACTQLIFHPPRI